MAFSGINFRTTAGFVTDAAGDTYWLEGDNYPTTRGGLTFGALNAYTMEGRNKGPQSDARLSGIGWANSTGNQWRLDLPSGAGTYNVRIALGGVDFGTTPDISIKDGATTLLTLTDASVASGSWLDASGVERTESDWISSNVAASLTFSGTTLVLAWNGTGGLHSISHIAVEASGGGGGGSTVPVNVVTPNQGIAFASAARRAA